MKTNMKKDERTEKQTQKIYSEAYYVLMIFLFITMFIRRMFLHQSFADYSFEFAAFALGGAYALIRSLFCGVVAYNKKLMLLAPVIIAVVFTGVILWVNFSAYKEAGNMSSLLTRASIGFIIMLAFGYGLIYFVSFINKKRNKKLEEKYNKD